MELAGKKTADLEKDDHSIGRHSIVEYLPYVKRIVHRIAIHLPPNVEIDDLINAGIIGLIQAIERYDPARDNKFTTYATFRIKGAVLSELRSRDFLSRSNRRKTRELERAYLDLEHKLRREVKDEEVAEELGVDLDEFYRIKKMSSISFISFAEIGYSVREDKETFMGYLVNGYTEDALTLTRVKEVEAAVAGAIDELPEKERLVISLYYWDELTMKEIGEVLEITESRVSQIHSQAIIHLRAKLGNKGLIGD